MSDLNDRDTIGAWLVHASVAAGVAWTADAEYQLALTLGANHVVAVFLPLALDVYVIAAVRRDRRRDLFGSLALMGAAQVCAHLLQAHQIAVSVPLVTIVALLVPVSIWRAHSLAKAPAEVPASRAPVTGRTRRPATPGRRKAASGLPAPTEPASATPGNPGTPETETRPGSQPPAAPPGRNQTPATPPAPGNDARDPDETAATYRALAKRLGRAPSDRALGEELGVSRTRAQQLRTAAIEAGHADLAKPLRSAS